MGSKHDSGKRPNPRAMLAAQVFTGFVSSGQVSGKVFVPTNEEGRAARRELADVAIEVADYILQKTGQVANQPQ
jgi:hypothetical protein